MLFGSDPVATLATYRMATMGNPPAAPVEPVARPANLAPTCCECGEYVSFGVRRCRACGRGICRECHPGMDCSECDLLYCSDCFDSPTLHDCRVNVDDEPARLYRYNTVAGIYELEIGGEWVEVESGDPRLEDAFEHGTQWFSPDNSHPYSDPDRNTLDTVDDVFRVRYGDEWSGDQREGFDVGR